MAKIHLETGFAIVKDDSGAVRNKLCLSHGAHEIKYPYKFTVEDIESEDKLNKIQVTKPISETLRAERERHAAKDVARLRLAEVDLKSATTIAQLKVILNDILEILR